MLILFRSVLGSLLLLGGVFDHPQLSRAQGVLPECQPPEPGKHLLLIRTIAPEDLATMARELPQTYTRVPCLWQGAPMTRIGEFSQLTEAERWVVRLRELFGITAMITRLVPTTNPPYNPQPIGTGYAVLVDYFDRPEIARQVQGVVNRSIGLASYLSEPFLLVDHTTNQQEANTLVKKLQNSGFWATVVDSRRIILLTPTIHN